MFTPPEASGQPFNFNTDSGAENLSLDDWTQTNNGLGTSW